MYRGSLGAGSLARDDCSLTLVCEWTDVSLSLPHTIKPRLSAIALALVMLVLRFDASEQRAQPRLRGSAHR